MTYSPEDFESIEEVRAKLSEVENRMRPEATSSSRYMELLSARTELREVLKSWEAEAEAAEQVKREHVGGRY